jgi:hypothetical protein
MKPVHWSKLPDPLFRTSVWALIDHEDIPIDQSKTQALFAAAVPVGRGRRTLGGAGGTEAGGRATSANGRFARSTNTPAGSKLRVLTVQRANNVGIFLKKVSKVLNVDQLCTSVTRLEMGVLDAELLEAVLTNLPPEAEAKLLRALREDEKASFDPAERFCFEMARLPRLRPMLHALRLKHSLPELLERATTALATVSKAARQLMASPAFMRILSSLLVHGNLLNAGTARGNARGFKLDGLDKARSLKSADGKLSLLEYACAATGLTRTTLTSELGGVRRACKLPLLDVIRIITQLEEGIDAVAGELALCPVAELDEDIDHIGRLDSASTGQKVISAVDEHQRRVVLRFRAEMEPFLVGMRRGLEGLRSIRDETKALLHQLASWLGEDPNQANPDQLLKACADLVDAATAHAAEEPESDVEVR